LDENGRKMSKSTGNGIDPKDILDKYGAEPFRLWTALEGNIEKSDFRCSFERIEGAGKTVSKFWNVAKFINMFKKLTDDENDGIEKHLTELDKWVLNETNNLIMKCHKHYEKYDFHTPVAEIRHLIWETFASNYIELVKNRAYNQNKEFTQTQQNAAIYTLYKVIDALLNMLAPVMPLITYRIYKEMHGDDIHFEQFIKPWKIYEDVLLAKEDIIELNSYIWKSKKDNGKSLKDEVKKLVVEEKFRNIQHDIISAHNIKHLSFGERSIEL
jgi:valyl-tRNA synthetase